MSDVANGADAAAPAAAPAGGLRMRIFGRTDVGMIREHNEDNFIIADLTRRERSQKPEVREHSPGVRGTLFAVCDGMGGAAAGEVASQMAVDTIYDLVQGAPEPANRDQFAQRLVEAINEAGARIYLAAKSNRSQRGMGTTSTVAGVIGKTLFVGQVGDSRAYMVRSGRIKQITKDQSLVSKLIEAGQLTEAEAESYEHSHIILQALGTSDTVSVDLSFMDLCQGDCILLCSDGLSGLVTSEQMREVLTTTDEPQDACKQLTDLANAAGGHDNVTVIVARFGGELPPVTGDDEFFGYQPYVITEQFEPAPAVRASGRIKDADAPPPGKDVKYAVSVRPPPLSGAPVAMKPAGATTRVRPVTDDDAEGDLRLPVSNTPRTILIALLVLALLAGVAYAALGALRGRSETRQSPPVNAAHDEAPTGAHADAAPTVATHLAAPTGWADDAAHGANAASDGGAGTLAQGAADAAAFAAHDAGVAHAHGTSDAHPAATAATP